MWLLGDGDEVDWAIESKVWWWWWGCCGGGGGDGICAKDWVCELEIEIEREREREKESWVFELGIWVGFWVSEELERERERESEYRECFIFGSEMRRC